MPLLKPKLFQDVARRGRSVFAREPSRVDLNRNAVIRIPVTGALKYAIGISAALFFILGSAIAPTTELQAKTPAEEERAALEGQLKELESQIDHYEGQVTSYQKQGKTLNGEIARLNDKIAKLNLQIKAVNITLNQLDQKIADTKSQIVTIEGNIDANREALGGLIRSIYASDHTNLIEIFLNNPRLSNFFSDVNNVALLQSNLRVAIGRITDLKNSLQDREAELSLARADAATVKAYQSAQKQETDQTKGEKQELLNATKGQESKYQVLLKQTKETAAQIRKRIFQLLGGGELSFEQAYEYAKIASSATGVRPAMIMAVLDRESALGKNVGRCGYKTAMNPKDRPFFLEITATLNLDPETLSVSCPNADGVYGGAMGPAQFIPSTWKLYADAVSKVTGHVPPSPWNNADAFAATALYLKDAGAANATVSQERIAAARYYAGGNYRRYLWTYGQAVVARTAKFEEDIKTITSG